MDGIEIRVTAPEEYRTASDTVSNALMHPPSSDDQWSETGRLGSWEESDSLSAWDGDRCVGHAAGYRFDTLVPGGAWLPTNGVTRVGVLATHRRRGLLRALMTRLLVDAHERGQVLASLRASETQIYQRYGFGLAGRCTEVMVSSRSALPITGVATNGTLRLLRPDEILPTVVDIYERAARRPGVLKRPQWMWQRYLEKAIELGGDAEYVVVHTSPDGVDDGYAHYLTKWNEVRFAESRGAGEVYDLWGETPAIELALWDYLCNIDLVDEWFGEERPVDDVVQFAVADPRAVQVKSVYDEQWLRLLDVDAALTSRSLRRRRQLRDDRRDRPAAAPQRRHLERFRCRRQAHRRRRRRRPLRRCRNAVGGVPRRHAVALARRCWPRPGRHPSGGGRRRRAVRRARGAVLLQRLLTLIDVAAEPAAP